MKAPQSQSQAKSLSSDPQARNIIKIRCKTLPWWFNIPIFLFHFRKTQTQICLFCLKAFSLENIETHLPQLWDWREEAESSFVLVGQWCFPHRRLTSDLNYPGSVASVTCFVSQTPFPLRLSWHCQKEAKGPEKMVHSQKLEQVAFASN